MPLKDDERIDQLFAEKIQIIQSPSVFSFSLDAVLLAQFPRIPKKGTIVDLCAGNGAVGLFVSRKSRANIIGIEIQPRLADMARRSAALNQLEEQITVHTLDLKKATEVVKGDSVDLVLCNPPYFKEMPQSKKNPNEYLAIARHEICTNLEEVIHTASQLLKMNGRLALVHRPERFLEITSLMTRFHIAPKRVQFIYPRHNKEANTVLIEGIRWGKTDGLKILPPLFVYEGEEYSEPIKKMLYGEEGANFDG